MTLANRLGTGLTQRLALTPRLAQSLRLLAMPGLELAPMLEAALQANPLLERAEPGYAESEEIRETREEVEPWETLDWAGTPPPETEDAAEPAAEEDLREYLERQLALERLSRRDVAIAHVVINAIDDDGYLREDAAALADALDDLQPPPEAAEIEAVIRRIQTFEPTGIAARDPTECLLLQLAECPAGLPRVALAQRLVCEHFEALATAPGSGLCAAAGCSPEELAEALALVRSLDPHPGYRLGSAAVDYLTPELVATPGPDGWRVELDRRVLPRLFVNEVYAGWLAGRRGRADPLAGQLEEARWLVRSLAQREETLLRVGRELARRQSQFLALGPAALTPLTLHEVADALGVHESTVSRAVQSKSMSAPRGILPLRSFFSAAVGNQQGAPMSAAAVQRRIAELVRAEDPRRPLSDAALAAALDRNGVHVARRTVAKYREAMGLGSARERRRPG